MNVLGLFSGIGGFELGLQRAGFDISAYCEIQDKDLKVLRKNFPNATEYNDVREDISGQYDVICGGFPCQDISISGKNKGLTGGEKSILWYEYLKQINNIKPKYAIIENVNALLSRGLEIIIQDLAKIGYDATWTTFDSKFFGVPQRRRRVFIVAVRDGIPNKSEIFNFEGRDSSGDELREKMASIIESFEWDFTTSNGSGGDWKDEEGFAYFTRQSNSEYIDSGIASALLKRDYKQFTDVVLYKGSIRRVAPKERLLLQGYPSDWWDGCELSNTEKFSSNGMTVPVVEHVGRMIRRFDENV